MDQDLTPAPLTRRRFLKATLGGAALLFVGGLLPGHLTGYPSIPGAPLRFLDAKTAAIFDAIADALIDDGTGRLPRPSALRVHERFDAMLATIHPEMRRQSLLLLTALEHLTFPFGGRFRRFTRLPLEDRKAYLEGWAGSALGFRRMAFQAVKLFVHANYYTYPETWTALGYDGPWVGRLEIPPFEPPLARNLEEEPL